MVKMYSEKRVKKLVERLREEYDAVLKEQREAAEAEAKTNAKADKPAKSTKAPRKTKK